MLRLAICPKKEEEEEEEEDYLACLNFFREAQQNELKEYHDYGDIFVNKSNIRELYEHSLSIRYCYLRLLQSNVKHEEQNPLIDRFPPQIWLHVLKLFHEQKVNNLIFAYRKFKLLKIIFDDHQLKQIETDLSRQKFLPRINVQYATRILFRFSNDQCFYEHVVRCCGVAVVYPFFLLRHGKDSQNDTLQYDTIR